MKVQFTVQGTPPKKDGTNSMWRKPSEVPRLKVLRLAAAEAMQGLDWQPKEVHLYLRIYASPRDGDLDNFITGVCDGIMGAHARTPIIDAAWQDMPDEVKPNRWIAFRDDSCVAKIVAERITPTDRTPHYEYVYNPDSCRGLLPCG